AIEIGARISGEEARATTYTAAIARAASATARARALDLRGVVDAITAPIESLEEAAALPRFTARALRASARLATAESPDDVKAAARDALVPLPPWADRWLVDFSGQLPILSTGEFKPNGEAAFGYNSDRWGAAARGAYLPYGFSSGDTSSVVHRAE